MTSQQYRVQIEFESKRESTFLDSITVTKRVHAISADEAIEKVKDHIYGNYVDLRMSSVETLAIQCEIVR